MANAPIRLHPDSLELRRAPVVLVTVRLEQAAAAGDYALIQFAGDVSLADFGLRGLFVLTLKQELPRPNLPLHLSVTVRTRILKKGSLSLTMTSKRSLFLATTFPRY